MILRQAQDERWRNIWEAIVIILALIFMAAAFFQAGWIVRDLKTDDTRERLSRIEERQRDLGGRVIAIEGRPQKIEGRRK